MPCLFWKKAFDGIYFDTCFKVSWPMLWQSVCTKEGCYEQTSSIVLCRDWDPLGLFVATPNGPSLLSFNVFCWLYTSLALILMLWVFPSRSTPRPQPFSSWLHLICCGLGNQISELIKIMSKIRSSRLRVKKSSCVLWTVWFLWLIRDLFNFLFFFFTFVIQMQEAVWFSYSTVVEGAAHMAHVGGDPSGSNQLS